MSHWESHYQTSYLKFNDVILLEGGMSVQCTECPRYFRFGANPYDKGIYDHLVEIGVPVQRQRTVEEVREVIADIIEAGFYAANVPLDKDLMYRYVRHQVPEFGNETFVVPAGLYKIIGLPSERRGQKVVCQTYDPSEKMRSFTIYFYQGINHPTNIRQVKVIKDPEKWNSSSPGSL